MNRFSAVALFAFALTVGAAHASPPLTLEATIPLPDVSGRIDHLAVDLTRKRLFVAELGNNTVDAIDLTTRTVIHRITGLDEPQGIVYLPGLDFLVVANGGDGTVRTFSGSDFSPRGTVQLGSDADNVRLDPNSGHVIVGYASGGLAIIDASKAMVLSDIRMPGHPESFRLSASGNRIFVNVPDSNQIVVVDAATKKIITQWRTSHSGNFPMIMDDDRQLLAIVYRGPPRLTLIDTQTGFVKRDLETCGDADDVFFDKMRQRYYVSCGVGKIDVFAFSGDGSLQPVARLSTPSGGRTSLFVPELDRLIVAVRAGILGSTASLQIYKPD